MSTMRIIRKLDDLLEKQATCLKSGDIAGAFAIGPAIEKLVTHLEAEPKPEPAIAGLKSVAARNAGLIEAARRGVEAARAILQDTGSEDGFQAYDAQGRATRIGSRP